MCRSKATPSGRRRGSTEPFMRQVFIARDALNEAQFERKLYVIRKLIENRRSVPFGHPRSRARLYSQASQPDTIVYKGLAVAASDGEPTMKISTIRGWRARWRSSIRGSARTRFRLGRWRIPIGYICHNGEINTLKGNVNWMKRPSGTPPFGPVRERHGKALSRSSMSSRATLPVWTMRIEFLLTMGGRSLAPCDDDADSGALGRELRTWISIVAGSIEYHAAMHGTLGRSGGGLLSPTAR